MRSIVWLLFSLAYWSVPEVQAQLKFIKTLAGNDEYYFYGDVSPVPSGLSVDSDGNIYFVETAKHRVRKISATTNAISTVAGSSQGGYFSGDGGPASSAWLDNPRDVWVSSEGALFVADTNNCRIRRVSAGGIISTFAGSSAYNADFGYYVNCGSFTNSTSATVSQLYYPLSVTGDSAGVIYIRDMSNHVILKVQSGILTVFAGKMSSVGSFTGDGLPATSATLNTPMGMWVTTAGSLLIADSGNHRIRSISLSGNNIIRTVMGDGNPAWRGDGGPALNASLHMPRGVCVGPDGSIYVTDTGNHRIRVMSGGSGIVSTFAGKDSGPAASAFLKYPNGIALDSSSNLLVADRVDNYYPYTYKMRKLSLTTNIVTDLDDRFNSPQGFFIDTIGNVFIADSYNSRVRKIDMKTNTSSIVMTNINPYSVHVNTVGEIYVGESYRISRKNIDGIVRVIAGTGSYGSSPDDTPATNAQIGVVYHIFASSVGTIYFTDGTYKIRTISSISNRLGTFAGNGASGYSSSHENVASTSASLDPKGFWFDSLGDCFIADSSNHLIRKVTAVFRRITTVAGVGSSWFNRYGYSGDGGDPLGALLNRPTHIIGDNTGNLYVTDCENNQVRKIDLINNMISTFIRSGDRGTGGPATEGTFAIRSMLRDPYDVAVDSRGTVYFTDQGNNKLRTIFDVAYPTGQPTAQPSTPTGQPTSTPTQPTSHPSSRPTRTRPTSQPTSQPSPAPTTQPSSQPSSQPSLKVTTQPTSEPSSRPSDLPTTQPTPHPTYQPTSQPPQQSSQEPTTQPTSYPSSRPLHTRSGYPSMTPSSYPSSTPFVATPSDVYTEVPSSIPSGAPSWHVSATPSVVSSMISSAVGNVVPSLNPTLYPALIPSERSSVNPSVVSSVTPSGSSYSSTIIPTATTSVDLSVTPSVASSSVAPSLDPTAFPTLSPSEIFLVTPSLVPSAAPSATPTATPNVAISVAPNVVPSVAPSPYPASATNIASSETSIFTTSAQDVVLVIGLLLGIVNIIALFFFISYVLKCKLHGGASFNQDRRVYVDADQGGIEMA